MIFFRLGINEATFQFVNVTFVPEMCCCRPDSPVCLFGDHNSSEINELQCILLGICGINRVVSMTLKRLLLLCYETTCARQELNLR